MARLRFFNALSKSNKSDGTYKLLLVGNQTVQQMLFSNNTYYISTSGAEGVCSTYIQMSAVDMQEYLYIVEAILL